MATAVVPKVLKNFIGGDWIESSSGRAFENRNPANTDDLVGMFPSSNAEDVDAAVQAATDALAAWRLTPAPKRAEILYRAAETLVRRKEELARDMTREMGKILAETRGDVQEAIDMTYYMAGEGRRLQGANDAVGAAQQVRHVRAPATGRLRHDHAVEFSHGHSVVEDHAGAGLREYRGDQAGGRHAALDLQPGADSERSGSAARRGERRERRRARSRRRR